MKAMTVHEAARSRLPKITWEFWVLTLLAVAGCETGADFLANNIGLSLPNTAILIAVGLLSVLALQFSRKRYVPWIFWLTIAFINLFATLMTDNFVDVMGYATVMCVVAYAVGLLVVLAAWYSSENTISVWTIFTDRREAFYWLAALFTFALGTATCDYFADDLAFGFLPSASVYGAIIALTAVAFFAFRINGVVAFWIAYIFIRPMGAAFGNFLSHPVEEHGLDWGATIASSVFLVGFVALIIYVTRNHQRESAKGPSTVGALC